MRRARRPSPLPAWRPTSFAVRPRRPVDGVLQHARNGIVEFGRDQQNGIGGADTPLQLDHPWRRVSLVILVERRNAGKIENIQPGAFGRQALGGSQRGAVVKGWRRLPVIAATRTWAD